MGSAAALRPLTRAGLVATAIAALTLFVPPISVASAVVGLACSGTAWAGAARRHADDPTARRCTIGCAALLVVVIAGSAILAG